MVICLFKARLDAGLFFVRASKNMARPHGHGTIVAYDYDTAAVTQGSGLTASKTRPIAVSSQRFDQPIRLWTACAALTFPASVQE